MTERKPRTPVLFFGLILIGLGGTAALAAQTGLTTSQAGSILLLVCAAVLLSFLIDQARSRNRGSTGHT